MTTKEALAYLRISRTTFLKRVKDFHIRPLNYNPAVLKQHRPLWKREDVEALRNIEAPPFRRIA